MRKLTITRDKKFEKCPFFFPSPFSFIRGRCSKSFKSIGLHFLSKKLQYLRTVESLIFHHFFSFLNWRKKKDVKKRVGQVIFLQLTTGSIEDYPLFFSEFFMQQIWRNKHVFKRYYSGQVGHGRVTL